ncbi:MAG: FkbM family methyltransferase [Bacteroidales bacterium]|nr:FkbM family methyltransferase [Bacteroidales bacterium]
MYLPKQIFKRNSHNAFFKVLAGFGRSLNRLYENRNHDVYSNGELTVLEKLAMINPSVIIDGGANIGKYALLANRLIPGCKIYAFEPVESTFLELVENTRDHSNIIPVNKGLFKDDCTREMNIFPSHTHASLFDIKGLPYKSQRTSTVELIQGDRFLDEQKIDQVDLLKIDIEGAEYDALEGFRNSIKRSVIRAVQFEYGYINISTKKLLIDFYRFFEEHDFITGKIFPRTVEFRDYAFKYEDFLGPNFISVKRSEQEFINLLKYKIKRRGRLKLV